MKTRTCLVFLTVLSLLPATLALAAGDKIIHDAEYYIIAAQNGEKWAVEDGELDKKLAELLL